MSQLAAWADDIPVPNAILVVSAHWEAAPLTIGSTTAETPLTYDFWGFPEHYYDVTYDAPGAPALAATVEALDARRRTRRPRSATEGSTTARTSR